MAAAGRRRNLASSYAAAHARPADGRFKAAQSSAQSLALPCPLIDGSEPSRHANRSFFFCFLCFFLLFRCCLIPGSRHERVVCFRACRVLFFFLFCFLAACRTLSNEDVLFLQIVLLDANCLLSFGADAVRESWSVQTPLPGDSHFVRSHARYPIGETMTRVLAAPGPFMSLCFRAAS